MVLGECCYRREEQGKGAARGEDGPVRKLSRLLTALPLSPDHTEAASPTKKERKASGPGVGRLGSVIKR